MQLTLVKKMLLERSKCFFFHDLVSLNDKESMNARKFESFLIICQFLLFDKCVFCCFSLDLLEIRERLLTQKVSHA